MSLYEQFQNEQVAAPTGGLYAQYLKDKEKVNQPSYLSRAISGVKDYAQSSAATVPTFLGALRHPWDTVQKTTSVFSEPLMAGEKKAGEGLYQVVAEPGVANKVAGTAKLISGLAEAAFSPITGLFHIAENTPGLKQVADTINIPFTVAGFAGAWSTGKAVDWIPESIVSKESKDIFKGAVQEVGSLVAQIVIGGKIMKEIEVRTSKGEVVTPEIAKEVVDKVKSETASNPITAEKSTVGYEQFQQEMGQKAVEIKPQQPLEITGEQVINSRAKTLLEASVEKKLIEAVDTGEIPTHTRMNMAEQAKIATDLIETDKAKALDIALGRDVAPSNVLPESVYTALEIKALRDGDVELIRQLKNSQLPTMAGQALKALDSADPYSPVKVMRDIQKAREVAVEKKTSKKVTEEKVKVVKEIKEKIPKVKKETWEEFLDNIKCNY
jgi:hypothetical protein